MQQCVFPCRMEIDEVYIIVVMVDVWHHQTTTMSTAWVSVKILYEVVWSTLVFSNVYWHPFEYWSVTTTQVAAQAKQVHSHDTRKCTRWRLLWLMDIISGIVQIKLLVAIWAIALITYYRRSRDLSQDRYPTITGDQTQDPRQLGSATLLAKSSSMGAMFLLNLRESAARNTQREYKMCPLLQCGSTARTFEP